MNQVQNRANNSSKALCTVKIDNSTHNLITELKGKTTYQDFIKDMATYFKVTGIDPTNTGETDMKTVVQDFKKENNRIIKFLRSKERDETKRLDELFDALTMAIYKISEVSIQNTTSKEVVATSPTSTSNFTSNNTLEQINRNQQKILSVIDTRSRSIKLFQKYLQKQIWGKSTFGGKYIEDPTELNEEYLEKFKSL